MGTAEREDESMRGARGGRKRGARTWEGEKQGEGAAVEGSMRGKSGTHENKKRRVVGTSGQREREAEPRETEGTRAQGAHGRGAMTRGQTAEVPSTATMGSMRGTGSEGSAVEGSGDARMSEQSAADEEREEEGRDGERRETAATPQREGDEEREQTDTAQQPTDCGLCDFTGCDREQTKEEIEDNRCMTRRRGAKTARGKQERGGKSAVKTNKADSGSGRGRVALAQTIVVGRVYIQRMERTGMDRRDAGRPPREPG